MARWKIMERQYSDEVAQKYLEKYYSGRWAFYRRYIFKKFLEKYKNLQIVLDIGCGPYPSLPHLICVATHYVCIDISLANLRIIKSYVLNCNPVHIVMGDAEYLPFRRECAPLVISFGLLHHLPRPSKAIKEIRRVLLHGGLFIAHEPSSYWSGRMESPKERGFSEHEIRHLISLFIKIKITKFNDIFIEEICHKFIAHLSRLNKSFNGLLENLWLLIFSLEEKTHRGKDFLVTVEKR